MNPCVFLDVLFLKKTAAVNQTVFNVPTRNVSTSASFVTESRNVMVMMIVMKRVVHVSFDYTSYIIRHNLHSNGQIGPRGSQQKFSKLLFILKKKIFYASPRFQAFFGSFIFFKKKPQNFLTPKLYKKN